MSALVYYVTCSSDPDAKYGPFESEEAATQMAVLYDLLEDCRSKPGKHSVEYLVFAPPISVREAICRLAVKAGLIEVPA